jgi:hypothetical protein
MTAKFTASVNVNGVRIFPEIFINRSNTGGKFATSVKDASGKLPPMSIMPALKFDTPVNDTSGQQRQQRQIAYTLNCKLSKKSI